MFIVYKTLLLSDNIFSIRFQMNDENKSTLAEKIIKGEKPWGSNLKNCGGDKVYWSIK